MVALADPGHDREALRNVVENAMQRCTSLVTIEVVATDDGADTIVSDDGPGVPAGKEELIFEWFHQDDALGGVGLGLPIARSLARANGGDLFVDPRGFVLRMPIAADGLPEVLVAPSRELGTESAA